MSSPNTHKPRIYPLVQAWIDGFKVVEKRYWYCQGETDFFGVVGTTPEEAYREWVRTKEEEHGRSI